MPTLYILGLIFDQIKIVYFRTKFSNLQHVNKTPWLYVQQGKHPPINIQNILYMWILLYTHDIVCMLRTTWIVDPTPFHPYVERLK